MTMSNLTTFLKKTIWVLLFTCTFNASSQDAERGTIDLFVTANGEIVAGANIRVLSWSDENYRGQGISNSDGRVVVSDVPIGEVDVFIVDENGDVLSKGFGIVNEETVIEIGLEL